MKRAESLIPLSREHHQALVFAKHLLDAYQQGEKALQACWRALQPALKAHLLPHMAAEEQQHVAGLPDAMRQRLLDEHQQLRVWLCQSDTSEVLRFAMLLKAHVRFEEREVFPWLENNGLATS